MNEHHCSVHKEFAPWCGWCRQEKPEHVVQRPPDIRAIAEEVANGQRI